MSPELQAALDLWMKWDPNPADKKQIEDLVAAGNEEELTKRMLPRIAFGTAGLRGCMQAGFACMNDLIITQTAQGLAAAVQEHTPDANSKGIVIGYDGRYNSKKWADISAGVFASRGLKVHLFNTLVPTPFVAFGVSHLKAAAGVMITASHNPKQDNGYKVYWGNGCQITSPVDQQIATQIGKNLEPWGVDIAAQVKSDLVVDCTDNVVQAYYAAIDKLALYKDENPSTSKVVYTAMHGVGHPWVTKAFELFKLPAYAPVKEQCDPDPEFPTVTFPNPEEGKGALKLAIETAEREGSTVIVANDPDADRLAVAEKLPSGEWKIFNGNEIGDLLGHWAWFTWRERNPSGDASKCVMINSTVSSKMLQAMAQTEGFKYDETLTGFKWIGNKAQDYIDEGYNLLFAYEESIGYMFGDTCLDKDGVRAAAVFAEMAGYYARKGISCVQQLDNLYDKYGFFAMKVQYFFCYQPPVMFSIFDYIAETFKLGSGTCKIGEYVVKNIRDLRIGTDSRNADGKATLPLSTSSPMITFYFENGGVATVRGSGTEPKLKYYVELPGKGDKAEVAKELDRLIDAIIQNCLRPEHNGLVAPNH
eukprot:GFYU01005555.1.p1 GENE.GFYU01005555.1~~GFYU01005555.1.p1  ORF type:complete len:590 (+),score=200.02 GFYU01005555.1:92-1861(+)